LECIPKSGEPESEQYTKILAKAGGEPTMKKTRYDKEFKLHAVKQILEQVKTQNQVDRKREVRIVSLNSEISN